MPKAKHYILCRLDKGGCKYFDFSTMKSTITHTQFFKKKVYSWKYLFYYYEHIIC